MSAENVRGELSLQGDIRVTHTLQGSGPVAEKGGRKMARARGWRGPERSRDLCTQEPTLLQMWLPAQG